MKGPKPGSITLLAHIRGSVPPADLAAARYGAHSRMRGKDQHEVASGPEAQGCDEVFDRQTTF